RRRHTRSDRDWSSDVCSSDLLIVPKLRAQIGRIQKLDLWGAILRLLTLLGVSLIHLNVPLALAAAALSAFVQYKILGGWVRETRSEEHTSELQSRSDLVCRLL